MDAGLELQHVKMNGGAASYVLATADDYTYSDLDLIFPISLKNERDFDNVNIFEKIFPRKNIEFSHIFFLKFLINTIFDRF